MLQNRGDISTQPRIALSRHALEQKWSLWAFGIFPHIIHVSTCPEIAASSLCLWEQYSLGSLLIGSTKTCLSHACNRHIACKPEEVVTNRWVGEAFFIFGSFLLPCPPSPGRDGGGRVGAFVRASTWRDVDPPSSSSETARSRFEVPAGPWFGSSPSGSMSRSSSTWG